MTLTVFLIGSRQFVYCKSYKMYVETLSVHVVKLNVMQKESSVYHLLPCQLWILINIPSFQMKSFDQIVKLIKSLLIIRDCR
jgi:hypothetical protein